MCRVGVRFISYRPGISGIRPVGSVDANGPRALLRVWRTKRKSNWNPTWFLIIGTEYIPTGTNHLPYHHKQHHQQPIGNLWQLLAGIEGRKKREKEGRGKHRLLLLLAVRCKSCCKGADSAKLIRTLVVSPSWVAAS